jgi:putative oxidoreductase
MSEPKPTAPRGGRAYAFWGWVLGSRTNLGACRVGLLVLRLMLAAIFIVHGSQKAFGLFGGYGFLKTADSMARLSLPHPQVMTAMAIFGELGGGLMLLLGFAPRFGALLVATVMVVALCTVHRHQGFLETHLQQMVLAGCATIFIAGGGALSLWSGMPRRRPATPTERP